MKAAITPTYGPANVLQIIETAKPTVGECEILVRVAASAVTAGDCRLRAANFPGVSAIIGRLMFGVFSPKAPVQGTVFSGRVVEVGSGVEKFAVGDDVFGGGDRGAYADYLLMDENANVTHMPPRLSYAEAASIPYGANTALVFLRDLGELKVGDKVLIIGGAGGVGQYAVQFAKHFGAEVTAVGSADDLSFMRKLGADHVVDYAADDFTQNGQRYDVIFDIANATTFRSSWKSLTEEGRFLTLTISLRALTLMFLTSLLGTRKLKFGIAFWNREILHELRVFLEDETFRPIVGPRFPLDRIAEAHIETESGRRHGTVIVDCS